MEKMVKVILGVFFLVSIYASANAYDLVLVHGFTNKHQWSTSFLDECLKKFGSGNVYAIYTNESTRVWERWINGRKLIGCGEDNFTAGDDYVWKQAQLMRTKTQKLQQSYGLSSKFKIIAHSMGGLVSRRYIYDNPNTVAGLCTLGTPHKGSDVADVGDFIAFFVGANDAADNLKTRWVQEYFNPKYPAPGPMADSGKIYAMGGDGDGWDTWGWGGELYAGWQGLYWIFWTDSDGVVPRDNDKLSGTTWVKRFWSYDHYELVTKRAVAQKALQYITP